MNMAEPVFKESKGIKVVYDAGWRTALRMCTQCVVGLTLLLNGLLRELQLATFELKCTVNCLQRHCVGLPRGRLLRAANDQ
jgi:hypothetical protein